MGPGWQQGEEGVGASLCSWRWANVHASVCHQQPVSSHPSASALNSNEVSSTISGRGYTQQLHQHLLKHLEAGAWPPTMHHLTWQCPACLFECRVASQLCEGLTTCIIPVSTDTFGDDPVR